jgi:hypothetical protein
MGEVGPVGPAGVVGDADLDQGSGVIGDRIVRRSRAGNCTKYPR